jgi:hypothetical protein
MNTYRVFWISHRVEWAQLHRKLIDDVIVGIILFLDKPSESLFILSAGDRKSD